MMFLWKAIGVLLSFVGVTELSVQYTYKQSTPALVQDMLTKYTFSVHQQPPETSAAELESKITQGQSDHGDHAKESMVAAMKAVRTCHAGCGKDAACHKKCPKPWKELEDQCIALEPVMPCHGDCGHDPLCHDRCPLPENEVLKKKLSEKAKCDQSCKQGDWECVRKCPRPLLEVMGKCHILGHILACHHECAPGDAACHHACPKMQNLWTPAAFMEHHGHHHHGEGEEGPHGWQNHHHHEEGEEGHHDWHHHHHHHEEGEEGHHDWHHHHHHEEGEEGHHDWHHHHHHGEGEHHGPHEHGEWHHREEHHHGHEEQHEGGHHLFDAALGQLQGEMRQVKACHQRCGRCRGCHARCPQPWDSLASQCRALQPVWACRRGCGHNAGCHAQCPAPPSAKWARMLQEAGKCHDACKEGDSDCHHRCPRPLAALAQKCDMLMEKLACHERCSMEGPDAHACHHECPKMMNVMGHAEKVALAADPFHV